MAANQTNKGTAFRRLHRQEGAFVIPNPWDIGTARILASMGFQALATTSAGMAFARTAGRPRLQRTGDHALSGYRQSH